MVATDLYPHCHGNADPYAHFHSHADGYTDDHPNADDDKYADLHTDGDGYANSHIYADSDRHPYPDTDRNADGATGVPHTSAAHRLVVSGQSSVVSGQKTGVPDTLWKRSTC